MNENCLICQIKRRWRVCPTLWSVPYATIVVPYNSRSQQCSDFQRVYADWFRHSVYISESPPTEYLCLQSSSRPDSPSLSACLPNLRLLEAIHDRLQLGSLQGQTRQFAFVNTQRSLGNIVTLPGHISPKYFKIWNIASSFGVGFTLNASCTYYIDPEKIRGEIDLYIL